MGVRASSTKLIAASLLSIFGVQAICAHATSQSSPLPPPPAALAPTTDLAKALYGEWRPVEPPADARGAVLTIWTPMFTWGVGCGISQGQLRDIGGGRFAVELGGGGTPEGCRRLTPRAPFDGGEIALALEGPGTLRVERGGQVWRFARVDSAATVAREDFIRGEWLLANAKGVPFRGSQLTRLTFDEQGYSIDAANCDYRENGWIADRDWQVRPAGNQVVQTAKCKPRTLGDRMARAGDAIRLIAEPVETRMTVRIGGQTATLVPAARFPELAPGVSTLPPDRWAAELASAAGRMPPEARFGLALRAIGVGGEGLPGVDNPADPRALAFAGLTSWHYAQAKAAGLVPAPGETTRTLAQTFALAPIVVRAVLEGIRPVNRGDGLSLDYLYRVREGWRGNRAPGDLVVVRMPAVGGKSRSAVITPEPGAEVLLLASRTGYLAGRLGEGAPPSTDTRVVQMTLPLMRIVGDRLIEAIPGANVLGAAAYAGTSVSEARELALATDRRLRAIVPPRAVDVGGNAILRRYFVTHIGSRQLADPSRLWIAYDSSMNVGNLHGYGGVAAYFDGCTPVTRQTENGRSMWSAAAIACPGKRADGAPITELAVAEVVQWIEANSFPDIVCISLCADYPEYTVPLPGSDVILRPILR